LYRRFGARLPASVGLLLLGGATTMLIVLNVDLPRPELAVILIVRAVGLGLAMIPLLAGAVSALPMDLLADGTVFRTLVQRVIAGLGLAALTGLLSIRQQQHVADRFGLLPASEVDRNPVLGRVVHQGPTGLLALWQQTLIRGTADAYGDIFLIVGIATLASIGLVFLAQWGEPPRTQRETVEFGT
jgi:hypothetical protein